MNNRVLVSVAWPYANGPRHIGHVAGFGVPSDVFARYQRMSGAEVLMVSGTDEHGTPLLVQADKEGVSVKELADRYNRQIVEDLAGLGLSYDLFTRTTTRNHYAVVQDLFKGLYENGYMIKETTMGAVSPSTGRTLPDRYIEGTCPICGASGARGDQCDSCGNQLDPADLINPVSKINGETPKFIETEHFLLDLPALADALAAWLKDRKDWRPNVLKFSLNLLEDLRPRAMSRDIDWGIPIPVEGWQDNGAKKLYVWFDAVVGYLSASIEWAYRTGDPEAWKKWWNDPESSGYYFMGKDNITFHSQIWPAELLGYQGKGAKGGSVHSLGELNLPTEVVSSEFLTMSGSKFSSSKGIVIYVKDFLKEFGADPLRYFIAVAGPENNDTDFTWDEFVRRVNNELANGWGNLVNRTVSMAYKNFGEVPTPGELTESDKKILAQAEEAFGVVGEVLAHSRFKQGITHAMHIVGEANAYIAEQEPWKLAKDESQRERLATVLWTALQVVSDCNVLLTPYLPHIAQQVHETLGRDGVWAAKPQIVEVTDDMPVEPIGVGVPEAGQTYPVIMGDYVAQQARWARIDVQPGTALSKPKPLIAKLDPELGETGPEWAPVNP
ncbi:methionine--tRNA ligase [Corynebacterium diphtheriae]|uniref:methionine--tRNA ligase n=1 Tax=Corynebacterium diphtheriae TaxID=1717 RepID=UPI000B4BD0B2|nr:methionine--tRNA ligase [Corynebacterium diphtheriae]OWN11716.1 methionine--tRNA ligase [Corynebacterium belfantii]MBG9262590.1 methionine--tRNA ligase [Corynebacterium diphtheriae bv. gravis]OWM56070.1 methionine--tRNA ligase [Corynebacterium diphtheriae]OWM99552.1 methionine--tRNA ligase [Corynebacterium diphtheriae bv. mitis]OWN07298.1 methionine--tRNA ligase [Corynebacterium diphtheriae bv. mitis]